MPCGKLVDLLLGTAAAVGSLLGGVSVAAWLIEQPTLAATAPHCTAAPATDAAQNFGTVHFANSCAPAVQPALNLEVARLHSFESAVSRFEAVAQHDPGCAIAYWGAAMSARGNPLGGVLGDHDLRWGHDLVGKAKALGTGTPREKALIDAMDVYYRPYPDQTTRARAYADRMDQVRAAYPDDPDIAALDGLAIIEGVDLNDETHARQKRAGAILEAVMAAHPEHPGAPHYLIHADDYTALAARAVHAAEIYPTLAPSSSHGQHMPSHIWSMLGAWDKSIKANRVSGAILDPAAGRSAVRSDMVYGHAFDFIAYARLQQGEDKHVAADIAAGGDETPLVVRARYPLERGDWRAAAVVPVGEDDPFDVALARFTRAYGAARAGEVTRARKEVQALEATRAIVQRTKGEYWAVFVNIYAKAAEAWLAKAEGHDAAALGLMAQAAAMDDGHEKHIYLENKIVPMREALGDMEAGLGHPAAALAAYTESLRLAPNRYRSLLGAAEAAAALGEDAQARAWYGQLVALAQPGDDERPGLKTAQAYLAAHG